METARDRYATPAIPQEVFELALSSDSQNGVWVRQPRISGANQAPLEESLRWRRDRQPCRPLRRTTG
jgi:hypothetical protein